MARYTLATRRLRVDLGYNAHWGPWDFVRSGCAFFHSLPTGGAGQDGSLLRFHGFNSQFSGARLGYTDSSSELRICQSECQEYDCKNNPQHQYQ